MTATRSPFPKLSQAWRLARVAGWAFAAAAVSGFLNAGGWPSKTALAAVLVGAAETGWRQAFPAGKQSGWLAVLVAAYRQIAATSGPPSGPPAEAPAPVDVPAVPPAVTPPV